MGNTPDKETTVASESESESEYSSDSDSDTSIRVTPNKIRGVTENGAAAFETTGNKVLDLFVRGVRNIPILLLISLFNEAFSEDPKLTILLLLNFRDIQRKASSSSTSTSFTSGRGKGEKFISQILMAYIKIRAPELYEDLLPKFLLYGYWKDVLIIAHIARLYNSRISIIPELNLFANTLKNDILITSNTRGNENKGITLCAKWAPREGSHFDNKPLGFATALSKHMGMTKKEYRQTISRLTKKLNVLECSLSLGKEDEIDFAKLPSVAHLKNRKVFKRATTADGTESEARRRLMERYKTYLASLKRGETKINASGTQLHELVGTYLSFCSDTMGEEDGTIEALFKEKLDVARKAGGFSNAMAVVDVSGSMSGLPMQVSIALGIFTALLTEGSFHRKLITFSEQPQWFELKGESLNDQVFSLKNMPWGRNTNIMSVFELLLSHAKTYNLSSEQMVETLFIFTDMQFDSACESKSDTIYEVASKMFIEAGYVMPKVVFWNLRASLNAGLPVTQSQPGVALMSGFCESLLGAFIENKTFDPMSILLDVLKDYEFDSPYFEHDTSNERSIANRLNNIDMMVFETACNKSRIKKAFSSITNKISDKTSAEQWH